MADYGTNEIAKKLNDFLLTVGEVDVYPKFVPKAMTELGKLVSFDQAVIIYMDANSKVIDCLPLGVPAGWKKAYLQYYAKLQNSFDFELTESLSKAGRAMSVEPVTWSKFLPNEFVQDCISPRGIIHSVHLSLYDTHGRLRTLIALDRLRDIPFSEQDVRTLNLLVPHLDNLHRKFFLTAMPSDGKLRRREAMLETAALTKREKEIVSYLCDGNAPAEISTCLNISVTTTHKHISNIYKKLEVSNLQELLVRLLNERSTPGVINQDSH